MYSLLHRHTIESLLVASCDGRLPSQKSVRESLASMSVAAHDKVLYFTLLERLVPQRDLDSETDLTIGPKLSPVELQSAIATEEVHKTLSWACVTDAVDIVKEILALRTVDINQSLGVPGFHDPPLHTAATHSSLRVMTLLLDQGAKVDSVDDLDRTLLQAVFKTRHKQGYEIEKVIELLLKRGCGRQSTGRRRQYLPTCLG